MAEGKKIASAAAAAGVSERSAYVWKAGLLPSDTKQPQSWRTRADPFAAVWESRAIARGGLGESARGGDSPTTTTSENNDEHLVASQTRTEPACFNYSRVVRSRITLGAGVAIVLRVSPESVV